MRGRNTISWGTLRAFKFVTLQSTAKIFLALNRMGGVHNVVMYPYPLFIFGHNTHTTLPNPYCSKVDVPTLVIDLS